MEKLSESLEKKLLYGVRVILITVSLVLLIIVVNQQQHINRLEHVDKVLDERLADHQKFIEFMNQGKRATYTDLRVLYIMMNGSDEKVCKNEAVCSRIKQIYSEHGKTEFSKWLFDSL